MEINAEEFYQWLNQAHGMTKDEFQALQEIDQHNIKNSYIQERFGPTRPRDAQ